MPSKSAATERRKIAAESFGNAASAIGVVGAGSSVFCVTRGQWSMIDAILHVMDCTSGPVRLSLWTWTVAEYEVQVLTRLRIDKRLQWGRLVIDGGARVKNAGIIREWQESFGADSVRYVRNHAKIARIEADGLRFLLRGSMNLNFNQRFEQFDLTEGGADFDLVTQIEDLLPVLADTAPMSAVLQASKISAAWGKEDLALFGGDGKGLKTWHK